MTTGAAAAGALVSAPESVDTAMPTPSNAAPGNRIPEFEIRLFDFIGLRVTVQNRNDELTREP
jgi:hypothetical protein